MQHKVGILTWHQYYNFGSMLQAYALQSTLRKMGIDNEIINYFDPKTFMPPGNADNIKYIIKKACASVGLHSVLPTYYSFQRFYYEKLRKSKTVTSAAELKCMSSDYRCIIYGSDQIWAPNVYNPVYMGDFVEEDTVKLISYAASIGLNDIPEELRKVYARLLSRFSMISVREDMGKSLLEECCGIRAEVVLDPTLLLEASEYRKIQRPVKEITKPFIFCYFLNKDHNYRKRVEKYAEETGCAVVGVSVCERDSEWLEMLHAVGPEEFLWLVDHAETVFTDSYHGTIFSLQFQKNFWTFERFSKNDPICQNSRIQQLNHMFNIGKKILGPDDVVDSSVTLNYDDIDLKLQTKREESLHYLQEALK